MNRYKDLLNSLEKQLKELNAINQSQSEQIETLSIQNQVLRSQNEELFKPHLNSVDDILRYESNTARQRIKRK